MLPEIIEKMYFCSAELLYVLAERHLLTKINDFPSIEMYWEIYGGN